MAPSRPPSGTRVPRPGPVGTATAVGLSGGALGLLGLGLVAAGGTWHQFLVGRRADALAIAVFGGFFGVLIIRHRPGNLVGWMMLANAFLYGLRNALEQYAVYGLASRHRSWPAGPLASWAALLPLALTSGTLALMVLLFPDGRPPSRRWVRMEIVIGAVVVASGAAIGVLGWPLRGPSLLDTASPLGGHRGQALVAAAGVAQAALALCGLGAAGSLAQRYRRSRGLVRQQLKWLTYGAVLSVGLIILYHGLPGTSGDAVALVASLPLMVGITIAVRSHRLYDIDRLISRTVAYSLLFALLGAIYLVTATALGQVVGNLGGGSAPAVAGATATVTVLFHPLRRRLQGLSDQRFRRGTYRATSVVSAHLESLRWREPEPGALRATLAEAIGDSSVQIGLRLAGHQGYLDERANPLALPFGQAERVVTPVVRGSEEMGVVVHNPRPEGRDSLDAVLRMAPAAFAHARLSVQVRVQLAEVRASRARILTAGDDQRRRIERDLHDGAQQRLVALGISLQSLRSEVADTGPTWMEDRLVVASAEVQAILAEVRELARGLHPPILTAKGLVAAAESLAERSPTPATVEAACDRRYPALVETAAFFVVAEGLTNVVKHAHAAGVRVSIAEERGGLRVVVSDDGVGGATMQTGGGLGGLRDRVEAAGGTLTLESGAGTGTRVEARLPVPWLSAP